MTFAATGTVRFTGTYVDKSCSVETGDLKQKINMGDVAFTNMPSVSGASFVTQGVRKITLEVFCASRGSFRTIVMTFKATTGGTGVDPNDRRLLKVTGTGGGNAAKGGAIAIVAVNEGNRIINLGSTFDNTIVGNLKSVGGGAGYGTVEVGAAYVLNGKAIKAGVANSSLPFEISYE
jgi:type 1 fimbria pilin